jgi:hypothetical protein
MQKAVREMGIPIFGSGDGEDLEINRVEFHKLLDKVGLPSAKFELVHGVDDIRKYLMNPKNKDKWLKGNVWRGDFETYHHLSLAHTAPWLGEIAHKVGSHGDDMDMLMFDPIDPAVEIGLDAYVIDDKIPPVNIIGYEVKGNGNVSKMVSEIPSCITVVTDKFLPKLKDRSYFGPFSAEIRVKKGESWFIDPCVSEDTEILTEAGWKYFKDLDRTEKVATLNRNTLEIEYQYPTAYQVLPYDGEMINISAKKSADILVTPEHGMWTWPRSNDDSLVYCKAGELKGHHHIPRTGKWAGKEEKHFILPEYKHEWNSGRKGKTHRIKYEPSIHIDMDVWVRFMALFLSEGSLHCEWSVNISQKKHTSDVEAILDALPFKYTKQKTSNAGCFNYVIFSVQLASYLKQFGLCNEKHVPMGIKQLSSRQIGLFLDVYAWCDGTTRPTDGQRRFFTTSAKMADDLQELIFKAGSVANISDHKATGKGTVMSVHGGKEYVRNHDIFIVSEKVKQKNLWISTTHKKHEYIRKIHYKGLVYDVTVPNGTIYIRRNGKPIWTSNCMRTPNPPGCGMTEAYSNYSEMIWEIANGRIPTPKPTAKYMVEINLFTSIEDRQVAVEWPKEIDQWIKLKYCTKIGDVVYNDPKCGAGALGSAIAIGDDLEKTVKECAKRAEMVVANGKEYDEGFLEHVREVVENGRKEGIEF